MKKSIKLKENSSICYDCKKEFIKDDMHYVAIGSNKEKVYICKECAHKRVNRVNCI